MIDFESLWEGCFFLQLKSQIVQVLKNLAWLTEMTGEGVDDAFALMRLFGYKQEAQDDFNRHASRDYTHLDPVVKTSLKENAADSVKRGRPHTDAACCHGHAEIM